MNILIISRLFEKPITVFIYTMVELVLRMDLVTVTPLSTIKVRCRMTENHSLQTAQRTSLTMRHILNFSVNKVILVVLVVHTMDTSTVSQLHLPWAGVTKVDTLCLPMDTSIKPAFVNVKITIIMDQVVGQTTTCVVVVHFLENGVKVSDLAKSINWPLNYFL